MDSGELHKDFNFIIGILEIRESQKCVLFLLLSGNGGFFSIQKYNFFFLREGMVRMASLWP